MQRASVISGPSCDIIIGHNIINDIPGDLLTYLPASEYVLVIDESIDTIYGENIISAFKATFSSCVATATLYKYAVTAGEENKTRKAKEELEDWLLAQGCSSKACVIAIGGGMVADLARFIGATYLHGIHCVYIPSTLVGMATSSVKLEASLNVPGMRNAIGIIHELDRVYLDLDFLETLPERQLRCGFAEIIILAVSYDHTLLEFLETSCEKLLNLDNDTIYRVIYTTLKLQLSLRNSTTKRGANTNPEPRLGISFQSTFENLLPSGWLYGECAAVSAIKEAEISCSMNILPPASLARIISCFMMYSLPISLPDNVSARTAAENILSQKSPAHSLGHFGSHSRRCSTISPSLTTISHNNSNRNGSKAHSDVNFGGDLNQHHGRHGSASRAFISTSSCILSCLRDIGCSNFCNREVEENTLLRNFSSVLSIVPQGRVTGVVEAPPSRTASIYSLLFASLGKGNCCLSNFIQSYDLQIMLTGLRTLGVNFYHAGTCHALECQGSMEIIGEGASVTPQFSCRTNKDQTSGRKNPLILHVGFIGTVARLLIAASTLVSGDTTVVLSREIRGSQQSIVELVDILNKGGCDVGFLDAEFSGVRIRGSCFQGGTLHMSDDILPETVSALMTIAPMAKNSVKFVIPHRISEHELIKMTLSLMQAFGNQTSCINNTICIPNTGFASPESITIQGDSFCSSFLWSIAALVGGSVTTHGVGSDYHDPKHCSFLQALTNLGCSVTQTAESTRVDGPCLFPHQAKFEPVPFDATSSNCVLDVDLSGMASTFPAVAVILATAPHGYIGNIVGISDQRHKHCDRIAVVANELSRLGVECRQLSDGLQVKGAGKSIPTSLKKQEVLIQTHGDHAIAMAFTVLGFLWKGISIADQQCVSRAYPEFWNDICRLMGSGCVISPTTSASTVRHHPTHSSIIVLGVRGAGKSTLGSAAAAYLGYDLLDLHEAFLLKYGSIVECIEKIGWEGIRDREAELLSQSLKLRAYNTVILCPGSLVETETCREELKNCHLPMIWVDRDPDDVIYYLTGNAPEEEKEQGRSDSPFRQVFQLRRSEYSKLATHWFPITHGNHNVGTTATCFARVCGIALGRNVMPLRPNSYLLPLHVTDVSLVKDLKNITENIDMLQLCIDYLSDPTNKDVIAQQVAFLRSVTTIPILVSVRTLEQGGKMMLDEEQYERLLQVIFHLGVDAIEVDSSRNVDRLAALCQQYVGTKVIITQHMDRSCQSVDDVIAVVKKCNHSFGDVIKVSFVANEVSDCYVVHDAWKHLQVDEQFKKPVILLLTGYHGRLSVIMNSVLTPITHPCLPSRDLMKDMLSLEDVHKLRIVLGLLSARKIFLVGDESRTFLIKPAFNAIFSTFNFPWHCEVIDILNLSDISTVLANKDAEGIIISGHFGSDSLHIASWVDEHARRIGAIDTVVKAGQNNEYILGFNTEWLAVVKPLQKFLTCNPRENRQQVCLIIGMGSLARAASYALHYIGYSCIYVLNQSDPKQGSEENSRHCLTVSPHVTVVTDLKKVDNVNVVINTVQFNHESSHDVQQLMKGCKVVFDASNFKNGTTPLISSAQQAGCHIITGLDFLVTQVLEQQRLLTRRDAKRELIKDTIESSILPK